jgi:hypothetical protein
MAIKLNKSDSAKLQRIVSGLQTAGDVVRDAVTAYVDRLAEAKEFRDEMVQKWQDEIAEKSERWQEGDAGSAATEFVDAWENLDLDELNFEPESEFSHSEALSEAPTEPGE